MQPTSTKQRIYCSLTQRESLPGLTDHVAGAIIHLLSVSDIVRVYKPYTERALAFH